MSDVHLRRLQYLELLDDYQRKNDGNAPYLHEIFETGPPKEELQAWSDVLDELEEEGLIRLHRGSGGPSSVSGDLTSAGRRYLREIHAARENPAEQKKAAANGLVRWLHANDPYGLDYQRVDGAVEAVTFEGIRLPLELFMQAADRLQKLGLAETAATITEMRGLPLMAKLTETGQDLADAGTTVEEYVREQRRQQPTNVTHFHGAVTNSNVAWSATRIDQSAQTTSSGLAGDELAALLKAIVEALPALELDESARQEVVANATAVQGELVRAEPDQGIVRTYMQRINETLAELAGSQLVQLLTTHIKVVMAATGAPIE